MTPLFWGQVLGIFCLFSVLSSKSVLRPESMGFVCVWGGGGAFIQFMQFSAIFAMSTFLATLVTPYCLLRVEGCEWGCCDSRHVLGCKTKFFVASSLA